MKTYLYGKPSIFGDPNSDTIRDLYDRSDASFSHYNDDNNGGFDYKSLLEKVLFNPTSDGGNVLTDFHQKYKGSRSRLESLRSDLVKPCMEELMVLDDPHMTYTAEQMNEMWDLRTSAVDFRSADTRDQTKMFEGSTADVINYRPMPELDLPIIPAHAISNLSKDIIDTEVVKAPKFNKHLYFQYIIDEVTQEEYQADKLFYGALRDENGNIITPESISNRGKGLPIDERPVALPTTGLTAGTDFDIIKTLAEGTPFDKLDWNFTIKSVVVDVNGSPDADGTYPKGTGTEYLLPRPISFSPYDSAPNTDTTVNITKSDGTVIKDKLLCSADLVKGTVNVVSAYGVVKAVIFSGKLSNEFNNRALGVIEKTKITQFNIPQAERFSHHFTREELDDFQVFMKKDLALRTIDLIKDNQDLFEDQSVLDYYESDWVQLKNSNTIADIFNYESFAKEVVVGLLPPVGYAGDPIAYQTHVLQWYIESLLLSLSSTALLDTLGYVIMTNTVLAKYLTAFTEWTNASGEQLGGVKCNHKYGKASNLGTVRVVASTRINRDESTPDKLRRADVTFYVDSTTNTITLDQTTGTQVTKKLPFFDIKGFPTDNEHMTYKHWKYTSYIVQTPSDAGFLSPVGGVANPGGQYMVVTSARRYGNDKLQGIAARVYITPQYRSDMDPFTFSAVV